MKMTMKLIAMAIAMSVIICGSAWAVPQDPQRVMAGSFFPVFVNNTGTNQTIVSGGAAYVNQTQYTPSVPSTSKLMFRPTP